MTDPPSTAPTRSWHALAPLPAIVAGAAIARSNGVALSAFAPNTIGLVIGLGVLVAVRRFASPRFLRAAPVLAALAIGATLAGRGIAGVHRWLDFGPAKLAAAAALAPWIVAGLAAEDAKARRNAVAATLFVLAVHLAQPDAGQATALAAAAVALATRDRALRAIAAVAVVGAAVAWTRHDPLAPVDHVERMFALAARSGPLALVAAVGAVAALASPFVAPRSPLRAIDRALLSYLATTFAVTWVGAFPVPLLGAGAGPVLGYFAILAARALPGLRDRARSGPSSLT